ncbi:MAG TPA: hypothetical protein VM573_07525, partial [Actinomycetota bacterium]|nr:hypothetical protein [Actinomycetota bacterium]
MRTLLAGLEVLRRSPVAFVPIALEAALAGLLVAMGAFPSDAASAPAAAVFPLGMYFDLKQSLAWGSAWSYVFAAVLLGGLIRSAALAGTLWLADGARGPFLIPWMRVLRLAAIAPLALFPAAVLHFTGHAVRYTPFVVAGALVGVPAALLLARRAVALDAGAGPSAAKSPRLGGFLVYAYLIALSGAGLAVVGRTSVIGAGVFLALLGPLHAIVLLGWRETARRGDPSSAGWATAATIALSLLLAAAALYDRTLARPGRAEDRRGHLMLLGG